jgi:hypothetical protein
MPARTEEIAGRRRQQEKFGQDIEDLKQQCAQVSSAQSDSDKKIGHLNRQFTQSTEVQTNSDEKIHDLNGQFTQLGSAQSNSSRKIAELAVQLAQTKQEVDRLRKQVFPPKKEFLYYALNGIISHLTAKCCGNVHDKGAVEISASSLHYNDPSFALWNAADLGNKGSCFGSRKGTGAWICSDFKELRIKPTHYTIRMYWESSN